MIVLGLCFLFGVSVYAAAGNGEWGSVATGIVIILILLLMGSVHRRDVRAWNNRQNYWADGGPNRRRR